MSHFYPMKKKPRIQSRFLTYSFKLTIFYDNLIRILILSKSLSA
ncbi:hypothetical protein ACI8B_110017 [Acinetobacter proteolyticus]|uniref:Uncharacterized protein n=1 Tax=Acinetobacter proteolyticus TaxID=1776741 RepID=A0A653K161_9GAMM|nr:hypothetical protein ACI8B_110017 [Acinetobacter proteolyticus]